MRKGLLVVAAVLLVAGCTGRAGTDNEVPGGPKQNPIGGLAAGVFPALDREPAPSLSGRTLKGDDLDLASYRGQVVVINFWGSWCAPCIAEAPNLNTVYAKTKASGVAFVGIDIKDDKSIARAFERSKKVAYPSLFDPDGLLLLKFKGQAPQIPPSTFVLDRQGRVAARFLGAVTESELLVPVQALANEKS
ncbi:MAG: thiol-disulfide isomerase and thioredoxin-like protein [Frankiales bacterium]|nr:thiol-disulfide isomerase and thioredoxin-like protein [Frankiales bacterium]